MKAALFNGPRSLTITSKPIRKLEPGELLVKVEVCGVCGTDVHIVDGTSRSTPPVVLGHEYAGVVADTASTDNRELVGRRVAVDPNIACGICYFCRRGLVHLCSNLKALGVDIDGGMAEYSIVPERQVYLIPPAMPKETSAFIEPVSCAVHGIDRAGVKAGDTVIIIGGGTIGLIMLQLAKNAGAASVIVLEPIEHKRRIAAELGAELVLDPSQGDPSALLRDAAIQGGDVVIECVGKPQTMQLAIDLARRGGTVEFFGVAPIGEKIPLEPNQVYYKELTIVGSYVNPHTFDRSIALLTSGKLRVDAFQIDRFPLDGVHEALRRQKEGTTIKSIIVPNS